MAARAILGGIWGIGLAFTKMSTIFVGKWDRFATDIVIADKNWLECRQIRRIKLFIRKLRDCKWPIG